MMTCNSLLVVMVLLNTKKKRAAAVLKLRDNPRIILAAGARLSFLSSGKNDPNTLFVMENHLTVTVM